MKRLNQLIIALLLCTAAATQAFAESDKTDPYQMVQGVAQAAFDRIKKEQPNIAQNPEVLRDIMEQELMPYVDYRFSAFKVLGKHYKKVSKPKLLQFVKVFREYLITTYAVAMGYYDDQTVEFEPAANYKGKKVVTVRAVVKEPGRPDIKIAFKVRKNSKTNEWKAYDMVAEGISMLSSKQSEFESILRQQGVDVVIKLMQDKINQPISLQAEAAESE